MLKATSCTVPSATITANGSAIISDAIWPTICTPKISLRAESVITLTKPSRSFSDEKIKNDLASLKLCGDICLHCYDIHGDTSQFQYNKNVVGVELEQLRNIPIVIGIASEVHRRDAILGAIAGKYINTLVTDINCARTL